MGHSDFLSCYLDYDRAFELYFVDGKLAEITDLASAIKEWQDLKKIKDLDQKIYGKKYYEYCMKKPDYQDEFAQKYLKYQYNKTLNIKQ